MTLPADIVPICLQTGVALCSVTPGGQYDAIRQHDDVPWASYPHHHVPALGPFVFFDQVVYRYCSYHQQKHDRAEEVSRERLGTSPVTTYLQHHWFALAQHGPPARVLPVIDGGFNSDDVALCTKRQDACYDALANTVALLALDAEYGGPAAVERQFAADDEAAVYEALATHAPPTGPRPEIVTVPLSDLKTYCYQAVTPHLRAAVLGQPVITAP